MIKVAVTEAETARKAKPDEKVLSECYSGELTMARKELATANKLADPTVKSLLDRFAAACPDAK